MTLSSIIISAAQGICDFNTKISFGRLGPDSLKSYATLEDIGNQAKLVLEEYREYQDATDVRGMLDGAVDMLVTEVWLDVLEHAAADHAVLTLTIEESIQFVLNKYERAPITLRCVEPMIMLSRLGVDVDGAVNAILADNNTKFITEVQECAATVEHYRNTVKVDCEARPLDHFKREWGVFRLPDLKLLKPNAYVRRAFRGEGLDLDPFIPAPLRQLPCISAPTVVGPAMVYRSKALQQEH